MLRDNRRYGDFRDQILLTMKSVQNAAKEWFEMSCQLHDRLQMASAWYHVTYHPTYYREDFNWAKIGFYPFLTNFLAKCPYFETGFSKNRVSNVKLNFWNIKL